MLHINPTFNVRFYVRTTKTQGGDSPTPLRGKAWISATKQYLYFTTKVPTTKRKWADFATDGTPAAGADPDLVKVVDTYKAAAQLVLAGAAVNNRIHLLSSDELTRRIHAVVTCMEKQKKEKNPQPILVFTTPRNVPTCAECKFRADRICTAQWPTELEAVTASDFALYNRKCSMRKLTPTTAENFMSRYILQVLMKKANNPDMTMEEAAQAVGDEFTSAWQERKRKRESEEGKQ